MVDKGDYIKILSNSPIPCMWITFKKKDAHRGYCVNIVGINKKLEELSTKKIEIKEEKFFYKNKYDKLINIIGENTEENISIVDFVDFLGGFYQIDISNITDELYVIWYTKKIELNENLEILLDNIGAFTWCKDTNGRYVYTNIKSEIYQNVISGSIVGKTDYEVFPEDVAKAFRESDKELLSGEKESIECLTFFNGKLYDGLNYVVKNDNGDILGTVGICKEALLQDNIESDSISDSKILQLISDTIPDSIFFKDNKGVFRHCNKVFAEHRNLSKYDIIGKKEKEINTPEEKINKFELEEKKIRESKETSKTISSFTCSDGTIKYLETIKVPFIDRHGMVGGVLGIARDITDRKQAELEFERLRMEFFANLSHEFKTPLNLIFSSIQLIEFMIDRGEDSYNYRNYTNIIKQNGYRLLKMVNNLIDSTRLSAGCLEYVPQNYNIVEFIENICDSVQYYANQENINLIFDTNLEEKIMAFDLEKMERILLNLLSNAIKYNKEYGFIEVILDFEDENLYITVKDSGIGIPDEKLDDVFKLFKQINNRITKLSEGSGIGLSIVKSLVDLHNGNIRVESKKDEGSQFTIKLPITICTKDVHKEKPVKYNRYVETIDIEFSDIYSSINT